MFGYTSDELHSGSHQKVVVECVTCHRLIHREFRNVNAVHQCPVVDGDKKKCFRCDQWKDLSLFNKSPSGSGGVSKMCSSKASFLDRDPLPAYEKGVSHVFSGKRVKRGLYRSADGREINADVNGSANIGRKVIRDGDVIARLDRSVAATPERINPLKFFCV